MKILLVAVLVTSCARPVQRQTTMGDARSPDRWLEGVRCAEAPGGVDVRVEVVEVGLGSAVVPGETVRVHYVARLPTGETVRDTRAGRAHEMVVGSTRMICGFERGMAGMLPGEQRRVSVPWQLAFGEAGKPPAVGAQTDLIFVIDLYLPGGVDSSQSGSSGRPPGQGGGRRR